MYTSCFDIKKFCVLPTRYGSLYDAEKKQWLTPCRTETTGLCNGNELWYRKWIFTESFISASSFEVLDQRERHTHTTQKVYIFVINLNYIMYCLRRCATSRTVPGSIPGGFSVTYYFRPYHGSGVDSAPSGNEYQANFLGVKEASAWDWPPYHLHVPNVMKIWEPKPPGTLWDPQRSCYGTALTFTFT